MADNDQDKTEYVSQKKLEQSREKGELPRSQELSTFIVFALVLIYFGMTRQLWFDGLGSVMRDMLDFNRHLGITVDTLGEFMLLPIARTVLLMAPLFGLILVISPLVNMAQTGFNIARDKLSPDWSRIDPSSGLQRLISLRQWVEGAKSCFKIALFAWLAWGAIEKALPQITLLGAQDVRSQLSALLDVSFAIGVRVAVTMAILAVLDYGYQWWEFQKRLKMTPQEMKEELKEREGNPLIKQRQRSLQMQRARQRMMQDVPKASVIVTNPTHYAVALTYNRAKAPAPYVCAKGADLIAQRIREVAREHGVPIVENKLLARALYRQVKIGRMVPNEFFKAVAEVLAFVHWLKIKKKAGASRMPARIGGDAMQNAKPKMQIGE